MSAWAPCLFGRRFGALRKPQFSSHSAAVLSSVSMTCFQIVISWTTFFTPRLGPPSAIYARRSAEVREVT
eukprot:CAMPEP_0169328604 /NCGR_PEP_ID=MMETSP1017-20121227/12667_1 /TAXON_ID=342587 /ORGANISM="Karlodinium micrum, Strain CCMP2283" /LENGTH=69 /DNA_ID=CAMNT_0009423475 /DNA_START=383 /DNA_END=592 /DNA_ORIENTATION=+